MGDGPLIISAIASRRLKLLLSHGVELPQGLQHLHAGLAGTRDAALTPGKESAASVLLAQLLLGPAQDALQVSDLEDGFAGGENGTEAEGDLYVPADLAVSLPTLKIIKLNVGALVEVANAQRQEVPAHLVRIAVAAQAHDGAALLSPMLAHNLGLALHLHALLPSGGGGAAREHITVRRYEGCTGARLATHQESSSPGAEDTETRWTEVAQPASGDVEVPVAREVHLSVVRMPAPDLFQLPPRADASDVPRNPEESGAGAANPGGRAGPLPAEDDAVQAIQRHFLGALRLVCQGDVLAVLRGGPGMQEQLLFNLALSQPPGEGQSAAPRVMFVRVAKVLPRMERAQAVDVEYTAVKLVGSCSSSIPVGAAAYLGSVPSLATMLGSDSITPAGLEFLGTLFPAWRRLAELLVPLLHPAAAAAGPLRLSVLLHGPSGSGKQTTIAAAAAALGAHVVTLSCHDLKNNATSERSVLDGVKAAFSAAADYRPALLVLRQFNTLGEGAHGSGDSAAARVGAVLAECVRNGISDRGDANGSPFPSPVVLVACAPTADDVAPPLRRCFTHELEVAAPEQDAREGLLRSFMLGAAGGALPAEAWERLARHTAGLLPKDLRSLAADACGMAAMQAFPAREVLAGAGVAPRGAAPIDGAPAAVLADCHLDAALDHVRLRSAEDLGAPKIPDVRWDDVGGLEDVKRAILDTVELPLKHPELFAGGLRRRSGVLLYGPPGTGKTLLAKAVATECALNFMSVKGPELINMYVGESERQIRDVFARARAARPCVVFFDELDSLAPARGRGADSGGVMDRVVSQLLAEIDGVQGGGGSGDIFVIGATNRPDLLDAALLRPGRLDRLLYVGAAAGPEAQLALLRALTRKFVLHEDVDLHALAARCPPRLTGADVYALCADAWMAALKRTVAQDEGGVDGGGGAVAAAQAGSHEEEQDVVVAQDDFEGALAELRPSLSEEDVLKYEAIRAQHESR